MVRQKQNISNLTLFDGKVVCPRCEGNGLIFKAFVKPINKHLLICDECDACWEFGDKISFDSFKDLSSYLEYNGASYNESEFEDQEYNWV